MLIKREECTATPLLVQEDSSSLLLLLLLLEPHTWVMELLAPSCVMGTVNSLMDTVIRSIRLIPPRPADSDAGEKTHATHAQACVSLQLSNNYM